MFKKIFYSLTILAMLFGMFGVMGQGGVTPAAAFSPAVIGNNFVGPSEVLPYHGWRTDFTILTANVADPATTCFANPAFDTGWEQVTTGPAANFLHVHSTTAFHATIAVFEDDGGLGAQIECQNSGPAIAAGLHEADLIIPVDPNTTYHVYIAPRAFGGDPVVVGDDADLWIGEFEYGGGIIANLCESNLGPANNRCDGAAEALVGATVQAQLSTGGTIYDGNQNITLAGLGQWISDGNGDLFVDVPDPDAGTSYTLGISSLVDGQSMDTIWFVPAVGSFLALDPDDSTSYKDSFAVDHAFLGVGGGNLGAQVFVAATNGLLPNFELPLGTSAAGGLPAFRIIPGGFYDFEVTREVLPGTDYYLVSLGVDCLNVGAKCPLAFDARDAFPGALAHPHASIDRWADFGALADDFAVGAPGTNFETSRTFLWNPNDDIVVSAGVDLYMDATGIDGVGDIWVLQATTPGPIPSTMAANTAATAFAWEFLVDADLDGDADLFTTLISPPLLGGGVANEVPWTSAAGPNITASYTEYVDDAGNILIAVSPIDYVPLDYFPVWPFGLAPHRATTNDPWVEAWVILGDVLGVVDPAYVAGSLTVNGIQIGRNAFERCVDSNAQIDPACPFLLYAISPTDTRMSGHWSWSWVEGMYEMGLTTGTAPGVYSPDMTISRAEMAVFLSRLLSDYSAVLPAPAATGLVFSDVPVGQWAAKYIEQLKAYNISDDCNPAIPAAQYCPDAVVTRAEMAKFIQQTFRVLVANAGVAAFNTNFGVITPGTVFVDVPAGHWANYWIDEMWWDALTEGCRTEMSGASFIHYYCPDDPVTRGQMAKFIVRGEFTNAQIRDGWPFLAPER